MTIHWRFGMNVKETNAYEGIWIYDMINVVNRPQVQVAAMLVANSGDVL